MSDKKVVIIGLGYVGLPLALSFCGHYKVIGFDNERKKIREFNKRKSENSQVEKSEKFKKIYFTSNKNEIKNADYYIVTVPTPVNQALKPDLSHLIEASKIIGSSIKKGSIVIYESTVFPGATEDVCLPILEEVSGYNSPKDFGLGYSPERINPGDDLHNLENVNKLISSNSPETLKEIKYLYKKIISADLIETSSIKVAETSKVIENTQRDLNIGLMNELATICDKLKISTHEVIKAASTKWNFISFYPGLVGGHCISVDPYYLTHRAKLEGISPEIILAGRRVNDNMWKFIIENTLKLMTKCGLEISNSKIGILGITFKENCTDFRNSQVIKIYKELKSYNVNVYIHDPVVNSQDLFSDLSIKNHKFSDLKNLDVMIYAVDHDKFKKITHKDLKIILNKKGCIIDIKSGLNLDQYKKIPIWKL